MYIRNKILGGFENLSIVDVNIREDFDSEIRDIIYWKDIFEDCALFADPYDPKDIAQKILFLLENINIMKKMGKDGRKLIVEKYNWEEESKKLLEIYEGLS